MKKTLFTTALALVLSVCGLGASVQAADEDILIKSGSFAVDKLAVGVRENNDMSGEALKANLTFAAGAKEKSFGYLIDGQFAALSKAIEVPIPLDKAITFGYGSEEDSSQFTPRTVTLNVNADPAYYTGYKSEGFFHLDFSKNPFDGTIEIMVMGEPLPASTVTLLVALGAGALLLLYKNRRTRGAEQA